LQFLLQAASPETFGYTIVHDFLAGLVFTGVTSRFTLLLDNLAVIQLVKKLPAFYGIQKSITVFARAHYWDIADE
jgi:hypothetical protein